MGSQSHECPKCQGEMTIGYIPLMSGSIYPAGGIWIGAKPDYRAFPLDISDEIEKYEVATYRCVKCGYLEWYAETRYY